MEKFPGELNKKEGDPIQKKLDEKLGVKLSEINSNREMTAEEWFAKFYDKKTIKKLDDLPVILRENHSQEELQALIDDYTPKPRPEEIQTELDFPE